MAEASKGYVSLFDLGESKDDAEVDYSSLYMHHYRVGDTRHVARDTCDTCAVQGDTGSGHTTPDTTRPKEVLDEVMAADQSSSPFRPTWLYGFNSK